MDEAIHVTVFLALAAIVDLVFTKPLGVAVNDTVIEPLQQVFFSSSSQE